MVGLFSARSAAAAIPLGMGISVPLSSGGVIAVRSTGEDRRREFPVLTDLVGPVDARPLQQPGHRLVAGAPLELEEAVSGDPRGGAGLPRDGRPSLGSPLE